MIMKAMSIVQILRIILAWCFKNSNKQQLLIVKFFLFSCVMFSKSGSILKMHFTVLPQQRLVWLMTSLKKTTECLNKTDCPSVAFKSVKLFP